jgi:UDP-N-acetylenolpyruvoylglucosamine reductase
MDADGGVRILPTMELAPQYREVPGMRNMIALEARFFGKPATREQIEEKLKAMNQKRWDSQPAAASAGCIFKNPANGLAGKLIDMLGCKGWSVGDAMVSLEHGNFIINKGRARAADVMALIERLKDEVRKVEGVELETEVIIVGEDCEVIQ